MADENTNNDYDNTHENSEPLFPKVRRSTGGSSRYPQVETNMDKLEDFVKYVEERIIDLTNLEIRTIVGDFKIDHDDKVHLIRNDEYKLMDSRINLIDGDVRTCISKELVDDDYEWMRNFHAHKEEKGHEIITGNVQAIMSLIDLFRSMRYD